MIQYSAVDDETAVFRLLEHRGIKQRRFAEMIGYSWDYLTAIRTGRRPMSEEFRKRSADFFQMPEDLLFFAPLRKESRNDSGDIREGNADAPSVVPVEADLASTSLNVSEDLQPADSPHSASGGQSEDGA